MSSASAHHSMESLGTQHVEPYEASFFSTGFTQNNATSSSSAAEISSELPPPIKIIGAYSQFVDFDFFFRLIERDSSSAYEREKGIFENHHGPGTFDKALHLAFKHAVIDYECQFMTDEAERNKFSEFIAYDDRSKTPSELVLHVHALRNSLQSQPPLIVSLWVDQEADTPEIKRDVIQAGVSETAKSDSVLDSLVPGSLNDGGLPSSFILTDDPSSFGDGLSVRAGVTFSHVGSHDSYASPSSYPSVKHGTSTSLHGGLGSSRASDMRATLSRRTDHIEVASFQLRATVDLFIFKESFNSAKLKPIALSKSWINLIPHGARSDSQNAQLVSMEQRSRENPQHHTNRDYITNIPVYLRDLLLTEARKAILRHLSKVDSSILQYLPGYLLSVPGEDHHKENKVALSIKEIELKLSEKNQLEKLRRLPFSAVYSSYKFVLSKVMNPYFQEAGEFVLKFSLRKRPAVRGEDSTWQLLVSSVKTGSKFRAETLTHESAFSTT